VRRNAVGFAMARQKGDLLAGDLAQREGVARRAVRRFDLDLARVFDQ